MTVPRPRTSVSSLLSRHAKNVSSAMIDSEYKILTIRASTPGKKKRYFFIILFNQIKKKKIFFILTCLIFYLYLVDALIHVYMPGSRTNIEAPIENLHLHNVGYIAIIY